MWVATQVGNRRGRRHFQEVDVIVNGVGGRQTCVLDRNHARAGRRIGAYVCHHGNHTRLLVRDLRNLNARAEVYIAGRQICREGIAVNVHRSIGRSRFE
jgi:hypothetical protein